MEVIISDHAQFEILHRELSEEFIISVIRNPEQIIRLEKERRIYQSIYYDSITKKKMILRVICEERNNQLIVITAYKTSKIDKYWAEE